MDKILRLYHGTKKYFDIPDLSKAKPLKDFGKGFYLTTNFAQDGKWAIRNLPSDDMGHFGYVYEYLFDMRDAYTLSCLELLKYDMEWVKTVSWYRTHKEIKVKYDLIYDRMADGDFDILIDVLERYNRSQASTIDVLSVSKFREPEKDQYCFKTQKALECLHRIRLAKVYSHKGKAKVVKWQ